MSLCYCAEQLSIALMDEKPKFDAAVHDFDRYCDDYYGIEFEDIIAGEIKCRFKYKQVEPNNFGLTEDEVSWCLQEPLMKG